MSQAFRPILLAAAVVLALLLVLAGAYFESTFLVLVGIAGVPIVLLGAVVLHYVNTMQRAGELTTMQKSYVEGAALRIERSLNETLAAARKATVPDAELDRFLGDAAAALAPHAQLERHGDELAVRMAEDLPGGSWARRAEQAVAAASKASAERVAPILEGKAREFAGDKAPALPRDSLLAACQVYGSTFSGASTAIQAKIDAVEKAIADVEAELDVDPAWEHVRSAKRLWKSGETELALKALADAENMVHEHLRPAFDSRRNTLEAAIAEVQRLDIVVVASPQLVEQIARLKKDVAKRDLRTAGLAAVEADEQRFATLMQSLTTEARARARRVKDVLSQYPGLVDAEALDDLVAQIEQTPEVKHPYQEHFPLWLESMGAALLRMTRYESATKVVSVMPKMEPIVQRKLVEKGTVRASDLPVREHGEVILEIYAKRHPEVRYENGALTPVAEPARSVQVEEKEPTRRVEHG